MSAPDRHMPDRDSQGAWPSDRVRPMNGSLVRSTAISYAVLLALGLTVAAWQGRVAEIFGWPGAYLFGVNLVLGGLLAALVLASSQALRRSFGWARRLEAEFRQVLPPLSTGDALALAVASGFVEEFFFRAILQPTLGLWLTSIGFGLLHYPLNRRMLAWPLLAGLLGLLFGIVYLETGSLLAVAVAHGVVNLVELVTISRTPPAGPAA